VAARRAGQCALGSRRSHDGPDQLNGLTHIDEAGWALLAAAPIFGSFLGVVIRRLPEGRPLAWGRSHCERCGTALRVRDLVPFASWLAARGRCRHCGMPVGWFYPAVEAAALVLAAISVALDLGGAAWLDFGFGAVLLALAWIDAEHGILPDALTLPLIPAGLLAALPFAREELADRVVGVVCGYLGLKLLAWTYRRWRGREGLGGGDAKLLAAAGAWVGSSGLPSVLFGGAIAALLTALALAIAGREMRRDTALPFGPFLALAAWCVWLFGPAVWVGP